MIIHFFKRHYRAVYRFIVFCSISGFFLYGCSTVAPPPTVPPGYPKPYKMGRNWYTPLPHAGGFSQYGRASWYGREFHGKRTANGEIYNMYDMTAAHKTLPFDTYVRVRNLKNNRTTVVRINDRGPFARGRIIDLSLAAARVIDMVGPGIAKVRIEVLEGPASSDPASSDKYAVKLVDLLSFV